MSKGFSFLILLTVIIGIGFFIWNSYRSSFIPPELLAPRTLNNEVPSNITPIPNESGQTDRTQIKHPVPESITLESLELSVREAEDASTNIDSETETVVEEEEETPLPPEIFIEDEPLPALDESDVPVEAALYRLPNPQRLADLFLFRNSIRHFVVTVDNATNTKLPKRYSFVQQPQSRFIVSQTENTKEFTLNPTNYDRYSLLVDFISGLEVNHIVYVYVRFYPLFQEAYEELGYPGYYFNDRLIEVINHLLTTPEVNGEIRLTKPKVYYQFVDPELEALSAGQKILLRIGPENATKVKKKLKELSFVLSTLG